MSGKSDRTKVVVISVVRDFAMYGQCVRDNPNLLGCEFALIDNREQNDGIPEGYNLFLISRAANEDAWYVFCHEDWQVKESLIARLGELDRNALWGVVGASTKVRFGLYHQWQMLGSVEECRKDGSNLRTIGRVVPQGTEVDTFDCQCVIVHSSLVRKHKLRFDEKLTFDLYAEDFCIAAKEAAGIPSRLIPLKACHWSGGSIQPRYYEQERYINAKYPNACYTGTSSWILGGNPSFGRRLTVTAKRRLLRMVPYVQKLRMWGFVGIWNYVKVLPSRVRLNLFFYINAKRYPYSKPENGITLVGRFTGGGSASKTLRDFAFALSDAKIPFQTFDTGMCEKSARSDAAPILTPRKDFRLLRYSHIVEIFPSVLPKSIQNRHSRIAFWEFESGFLCGYPDMVYERRVIAMSDFNAKYLTRELPSCKVSKILYPFHRLKGPFKSVKEIRTKYKIPRDAFVVLFNFDFNAGFNRKNPDGAVRAFAKAAKSIPSAYLVVKTKCAAVHKAEYDGLVSVVRDCGCEDRVLMINDFIPEADVYGLTNACDVYLSLHRGEGFGITLAEAMYMGKPVVCTNWSSTTEFCKPSCSMPIGYELVAVRPEQVDHPYYAEVREWAEPSIDEAADALVRLYRDPALRNEIGKRAAASIREQFSTDTFRQSVMDFLKD